MEEAESGWHDKLENFGQALGTLNRFAAKQNIDEMQQAGLIKAFEFTFELAWKTLQALFQARGYEEKLKGPRPVLEQALKDGFLEVAGAWEQMLKTRNLASHVYKQALADESEQLIRNEYLYHLRNLHGQLVDLSRHE